MRRMKCALAVAAACGGALFVVVGSEAASASAPARVTLAGTAAPSKARANHVGSVSNSSTVNFEVVLNLRDQAGAEALVQSISTPGSASYRQYLTAAQWEARFSPTQDQVNQVTSWLQSQGFSVGAVAKDRTTISASGTAAQVESAFGTSLQNYKVGGQTVRMAASDLSVPNSLAGVVAGALGINQNVATAGVAGNAGLPEAVPNTNAAKPAQYPPAPPAFVTSPPCSAYYAQKTEKVRPPFGEGYPKSVPIEVCGYLPRQMRSAYGVTPSDTGAGETVAIVDAYDSSTIASDAAQYFAMNDPGNSFANAGFTQMDQTPFDQESLCDASSWLVEQALDVESVHAMATYAHILYVGAQDCLDNSLFTADQTVIDNRLADVVTNSWGDTGGDLFDDAATRTAFDDLFLLADATGITVQYSSGDDGDNFEVDGGISAADYPASSPFVTAVGGTSLKIGSAGQNLGSVGWYTGRSFLCSANVENQLPGCTAATLDTWLPVSFDGGTGGFTSYNYLEPFYQVPVVPSSLALRTDAFTGAPARVVPDISLDADPSTGYLIGLTETFPDGTTHYGQPRYGGTSLASPLLAGIVADADQAAGVDVGFLNPTIYRMDEVDPSSIYDVLPAGLQANYRVDYADTYLPGVAGTLDSFRELYFPGPEVFCDTTGNCVSRPDTQSAAPGYDSLTGLGSPGTNFIDALAGF